MRAASLTGKSPEVDCTSESGGEVLVCVESRQEGEAQAWRPGLMTHGVQVKQSLIKQGTLYRGKECGMIGCTVTRFLPANSLSGAMQKVEEPVQKGSGGCGDRED